MKECFNCGVSEEVMPLLDAISGEGFVKVCEKCVLNESLIVVKKPKILDVQESAGEKRTAKKKSPELETQELTLKDIVDKNVIIRTPKKQEKRLDLVDNFNWIIMRARRRKHITIKQLAEELAESETALKNAEKGILPKSYYGLIKKISAYFGVKLIKENFAGVIDKEFKVDLLDSNEGRINKKILEFDKVTAKELTIADLMKIKEKKEHEAFEEVVKDELEQSDVSGDKVEFEDIDNEIKKEADVSDDISQEEIDKIIFGK